MEKEKTKRGFLAHIHPPHVSVHSLRFKATLGLGTLLIATFVILLGTGILLTSAYEPDFRNAYESTWEISNVYPYGGFVRSLHHLSGNLFVIASALHLLRILWAGAYTGPRYRNYLYGLGLFAGVSLALATGYFLPMSEVSYWALVVGMAFLDYLPLLGGVIKRMVMGGQEIANPTIIRLYVLHIAILPLFLIGAISLHLWRIRKDQGLLKPEGIGEEEMKKVPLTYATTREWTVVLVTVIGLILCAMAFPVAMVPRAIASSPPNPVKAAWFFIALQETLSYSAVWGGIVPMAMSVAFLLLFPLFAGHRNGYPIPWRKKAFFGMTVTMLISYAVFTLVGIYCRGPNWMFANPWKGLKKVVRTISADERPEAPGEQQTAVAQARKGGPH